MTSFIGNIQIRQDAYRQKVRLMTAKGGGAR